MHYRSIATFLLYFGIWLAPEHEKQECFTEVLRHSCSTSVFGICRSILRKMELPKYCAYPALLRYLAALRAQKARMLYRSIAPILPYFGIRLAPEHEKQECFTEVLRQSCSTSVFGICRSILSKMELPKYCANPALLRYLASLRAQKDSTQYRSNSPILLYFGIWQPSEHKKQDRYTEVLRQPCPTSVIDRPPSMKLGR